MGGVRKVVATPCKGCPDAGSIGEVFVIGKKNYASSCKLEPNYGFVGAGIYERTFQETSKQAAKKIIVREASKAVATRAIGANAGVFGLFLMLNSDDGDREQKPYLYRNMKPDNSIIWQNPMLGQSAITFGIRFKDVDYLNFNERISPLNNLGLSVTMGTGTYKTSSVSPQQVPLYKMSIHSFHRRIQQTQSLWNIAPSTIK